MNTQTMPSGFRKISRHDGLLQEHVHDAYKAGGKLPEPTVCPQCGAVFRAGHWQWGAAPESSHRELCPACHRIHDSYPAGFLTLQGQFFMEHRDEIMNLLRNHERHECEEHPLQRIMEVEDMGDATLVTTTDIHLARGLGEALHHAYHGELDFHYNPEQNLLRVKWAH